jgi:hypothetical protein
MRSIALTAEPVAARTRPATPQSMSAAPSPLKNNSFQTTRQRDEVDTHDQGDPGDRCLGSVQRAVQDNKPGCDGRDLGHDDKPVAQGETAGRGPVDAGGGWGDAPRRPPRSAQR